MLVLFRLQVIGGERSEHLIPVPLSTAPTDQAVSKINLNFFKNYPTLTTFFPYLLKILIFWCFVVIGFYFFVIGCLLIKSVKMADLNLFFCKLGKKLKAAAISMTFLNLSFSLSAFLKCF